SLANRVIYPIKTLHYNLTLCRAVGTRKTLMADEACAGPAGLSAVTVVKELARDLSCLGLHLAAPFLQGGPAGFLISRYGLMDGMTPTLVLRNECRAVFMGVPK
ncbi:hypothetical protein Ahia01_000797800, partial [Argonauta hians]